ncbi:MAG: hypothetical protein R2739_01630 [Chitinophagales bacterium]|nr:hypothetical protein [Bacteroidota bacterium]
MTMIIVKPKNQKEAELVESVLKKMRIPIDVVEEQDEDDEDEELIPIEDFFNELNSRLKKHYSKKKNASTI